MGGWRRAYDVSVRIKITVPQTFEPTSISLLHSRRRSYPGLSPAISRRPSCSAPDSDAARFPSTPRESLEFGDGVVCAPEWRKIGRIKRATERDIIAKEGSWMVEGRGKSQAGGLGKMREDITG